MNSRYPFPHERLDAWHRAREARVLALRFTASLPPGFADEAHQINKASASVVRNLCEGAGRWRPAEKVLKFEIASGEAGEAAGAVQSLLDAERGDAQLGQQFLVVMGRTAAMLTGLIHRHRP
ncbi:MAG: four helix bundle protein [Myxococcota bacterium]